MESRKVIITRALDGKPVEKVIRSLLKGHHPEHAEKLLRLAAIGKGVDYLPTSRSGISRIS